jgi:hypothetical protein
MPLDIREHRSPWYNFNDQSTGAPVARRRPFEGECAAGRPGRLPAQPGDRADGDFIRRFVATLSLAPRRRTKAPNPRIAHPVVVRCALLDRRMTYFDNHKLKRNFQDSLQVCPMSF